MRDRVKAISPHPRVTAISGWSITMFLRCGTLAVRMTVVPFDLTSLLSRSISELLPSSWATPTILLNTNSSDPSQLSSPAACFQVVHLLLYQLLHTNPDIHKSQRYNRSCSCEFNGQLSASFTHQLLPKPRTYGGKFMPASSTELR